MELDVLLNSVWYNFVFILNINERKKMSFWMGCKSKCTPLQNAETKKSLVHCVVLLVYYGVIDYHVVTDENLEQLIVPAICCEIIWTQSSVK